MSERSGEGGAPSACVTCEHRAIWHHDERGCQYHGNGPSRCTCYRTSDEVVRRLNADAWDSGHDHGVADGQAKEFRIVVNPHRPTPPELGSER